MFVFGGTGASWSRWTLLGELGGIASALRAFQLIGREIGFLPT